MKTKIYVVEQRFASPLQTREWHILYAVRSKSEAEASVKMHKKQDERTNDPFWEYRFTKIDMYEPTN